MDRNLQGEAFTDSYVGFNSTDILNNIPTITLGGDSTGEATAAADSDYSEDIESCLG